MVDLVDVISGALGAYIASRWTHREQRSGDVSAGPESHMFAALVLSYGCLRRAARHVTLALWMPTSSSFSMPQLAVVGFQPAADLRVHRPVGFLQFGP